MNTEKYSQTIGTEEKLDNQWRQKEYRGTGKALSAYNYEV
jgi:hypothetical protein